MLVEVIVPLPLDMAFTYEGADDLRVGECVVVPLGKTKVMTGVVRRIDVQAPEGIEVKQIRERLNIRYDEQQIALWEFVAAYYCAPIGEVYRAAVPAWMISRDGDRIHINRR